MAYNQISTHARLALLDRFSPYEIIEDSARDTKAGREGRFHLWGKMDGEGVDILLRWGGAFTNISVHCASLAPVGEAQLSPEQIAQAVCDVLSPSSRKD